jgi:hypothetical protein
MDLQKIPRPVLIIAVFLIGLFFILQFQGPHSICDSQADSFRELQTGYIFSRTEKKIVHAPIYERALANCKLGMASPGACFEYFQILHKMVTDLRNVSPQCGETFLVIPELKRALTESLTLMATVAWGEEPPEKGSSYTGKLETPDLALFCALEDNYRQFASPEDWEALKTATLGKLPGEARKFTNSDDGKSVCLNCDMIPSAEKALGSREEVYVRSLFALRCELLR